LIELGFPPVWIIFFGLGLDVVGAVLIISPLLYMAKKNYPKGDPSPNEKKPSYGLTDMKHGYDSDVSAQYRAWWGLAFLIVGFILQGVGNWLMNPLT